MIKVASCKLLNGEDFNVKNTIHVFAVLSQRLCLEPVIAASEAIELANHSVAHHMRLFTGFSPKNYTHSPSEPVLVMGSIDLLYNTEEKDRLPQVLNALSEKLCGAGLVEKGILGELGARILLLISRDFTAPHGLRGPDLSKPVRLLDFLDTLFGRNVFTDPGNFENAFGNAYVNFTHWVRTLDPIPEELDQ